MKLFLSGLNKSFFLSKHYPLKKSQLIMLDLLIFGFFKTLNFSLIVSLGVFYFNDVLSINNLINALFFLCTGIFFVENIVNSIFFRKVGYFFFLIFGFLILFWLIVNHNVIGKPLFMFFNIMILLLFILLYFCYYQYREKSFNNKNKFLYFTNYKIFVRNNIFIKSLSISLVFKVVSFIYLQSQLPKNSFEEFNEFHKVFLILSLPITSFTFVYNNIWGYFKATAKNMIIAGSPLEIFLQIFLKLIWLSIILDFIVSIILLIVFDYFKWLFILWFMVFSIYALSIAFIGSFIKYLPIDKPLSFFNVKRNSSLFINIITLLGVLPFILFDYTKGIYYLLFPIILSLIFLKILWVLKKTIFKIFKKKLFQFNL
ncbi:hypothetical protein N9E56_01095 [Flavobacteriaceae bacterium]|nr:hypothetical protein [Flavobacteriaceae bacterium]